MRNYVIYEFNQSGVVDCAHQLRLPDDAAAGAWAGSLGSHRPVEVWTGRQRIATVPPQLSRAA